MSSGQSALSLPVLLEIYADNHELLDGVRPELVGDIVAGMAEHDAPLPEKAHLFAVRVLLLGAAAFVSALLWILKRAIMGA